MKAAAGAAALAVPAVWRSARAAECFVVADPGGPYSKGFTEAFHKPFTQQTGIEVVSIARSAAPAAQVKAMVDTKSYQWEVVYLAFAEGDLLSSSNLLAPIDTSGADYRELPANLRNEFYSATDVFATTLGYHRDKYHNNSPRTWADFWDVTKFPGRRSMRKRGYDTPEIALMADGVAPGEVYRALATPDGVERAFRKLGTIKPHVKVWWDGGSRPVKLLSDGEAAMTTVLNGRIAYAIGEDKKPFKIIWHGQVWDLDLWAIPRGTRHLDLSYQFLKFVSDPAVMAGQSKYVAYGPAHQDAMALVMGAMRPYLPNALENFGHALQLNAKFWIERQDEFNVLFANWLAQK